MSGRRRGVLVTGGSGLVGAALVRRLVASGEAVTVLDTRGPAEDAPAGVTYLRGDVRLPADLERLPAGPWDAVFHLAAHTDVKASGEDPVSDFEVNALGTLRVLEWARARGVRRVVYPSTVAVYDPGSPMPLAESAPVAPTSPYGASKLAGEGLVRAWGRTYGMETVTLRLFNVYGPGMRRYVIHDLVRKLQDDPRRLTILGTGEQIRDYLYVDDAASALTLAADRAPADAVLNLGSGEPVRIADLADRIIHAMRLSGVQKTFTGTSWAGDIDAWYADGRRLRALGWRPEIDLDEGLERTVRWLLAHPAGGAPA